MALITVEHWLPLLVSFSRGSTDVVNLPVFEELGSLAAPKLINWYEDDVPLSEWQGITTGKDDAKNEVSWLQQCLLLLLDRKRIRRFHLAYRGSGIGLEHHWSPIGCKTHIPKSWTIELRESERTFTPKRQTGRKIACPLVHCAWLTWFFSCLCKFATDYQYHAKLCVDIQGCSGVTDEAIQAIAAANVKWVKLNLGETQITDKGISELCEKCPHLSVK